MHEHALPTLHPGRAMQELVCGRPAQDQRGSLRRVNAHRHARQIVSPKRTMGGVRPDHRHIGYAVANLEVAHAIAELIDFPDHVISHHKWGPATRSLWVKVAADQHVGVIHARSKHADPYFARAGRRQGSINHLQSLGIAEARDLNDSVARLSHVDSLQFVIPRTGRKASGPPTDPAV
jgi:hypothetical protein